MTNLNEKQTLSTTSMTTKFIHFLLVITPLLLTIVFCMFTFSVTSIPTNIAEKIVIYIGYLMYFSVFCAFISRYKPVKKALWQWFWPNLIVGFLSLSPLQGLMHLDQDDLKKIARSMSFPENEKDAIKVILEKQGYITRGQLDDILDSNHKANLDAFERDRSLRVHGSYANSERRTSSPWKPEGWAGLGS